MMVAVAGVLALGVVGCGEGGTRINGGGSSFVNPMMEVWTAKYKEKTGVLVNYSSTGSGEGVNGMIDGVNVFGCTDAPMNEEQLAKAGGKDAVIHIPLVMGAVVVIYNLADVKDLKLNGEVLADIYLGNIKRWTDKAIRDLNPGLDLPDKPIAVVHRADGSGTSFVFTSFLSEVSPQWKQRVGPHTNPKWPLGLGEQKNPGVAQAVLSTPGAIGYVEQLYALEKPGLSIAGVQNAAGAYVAPGPESVTRAADAALKGRGIPEDLCVSIVNPPRDAKDAYPISGTVWAVCKVQQPAGRAKPLTDFLRWCITDGQQYAADKHYARLPPSLVERAQKKLELVK
jgi:phosphate transport system substrate-binding protein